jgi:DeoR/GlpR family transcriptional regulator of sugar metabolism
MGSNRRDRLIEYISKYGEAKLTELEILFPDVSSMTIRRDLAQLEEEGLVIRVRGGAKSVSAIKDLQEEQYNLRAGVNIEAKRIIAQKALRYIDKGRSCFFDSGSTLMYLAKAVPDEQISILTSGPNIALAISKKQNPSILLMGGQLNRNTLSVSGLGAMDFLKLVNIDIAFMATSGFSLDAGLTSGDYNECELKKAIIHKANKVVLLMDSTKIGKNKPYTFARLTDIDVLITDKELSYDLTKEIEERNIEIC